MLIGEEVIEIRILHRQGKSIRAIARDLTVSRETVRKYLREPDREPRVSDLLCIGDLVHAS